MLSRQSGVRCKVMGLMPKLSAAFFALFLLLPAVPATGEDTSDPTYRRGCDAYSSGAYFMAFHDLLPFAAKGDAQAQFFVAEMLRTGLGTKRNPEEALIWYRRSAEQGHSAAQCNLGTSLYNGWGGPPNPQEAIDWWLQAAVGGNRYAMYNLGIAAASGRHIRRDYARAYRWMLEADRHGYHLAGTMLARFREAMSPARLRRAETMSLDEAMRFVRHRAPNAGQGRARPE